MRTIVISLIAGGALALSFVGVSSQAQDSTSSDKKFVKAALEGSLAEVNYAKLALQKSKDPNVTEFANKMIHDHEMLITEMKPLARKMGISVPASAPISDHAKYMELKMKSGTDFDHAYVEAMVKDHNQDLQDFIDEQSKTQDPDLKAAVEKGEGVIRKHTIMIDKIAHMGGIQTPPLPASS